MIKAQFNRIHNFNAGPSALPLTALTLAQNEFINFHNTGMSILEHSHRGKEYESVHNEAIELLRELLAIPNEYHVLFLQGGASQQFAMVPMNFLSVHQSADYILTGHWSEKALAEARMVGQARVAATPMIQDSQGREVYRRIPKLDELHVDSQAAYVHITSNNTLFGTQWFSFPSSTVPLVADMSSDFLSRPIDVSQFNLIYAGAQKNIGPSGLTVVIAHRDFVDQGKKNIPKFFQYRTHAEANSLYNTPPTFSIYLARNVLQWVKDLGGIHAIAQRNAEKADVLYQTLDAFSNFYHCPVEPESRSIMNVVFQLPSIELEERFIAEAKTCDLVGLKGHRIVGGIRVSLYNAIELSSVQLLVEFMREFAKKHQ